MRILGNIPLLAAVLHQSKRACSNNAEKRVFTLYQDCLKLLNSPTLDLFSRAILHTSAGMHSSSLQRHAQALHHYKKTANLHLQIYGKMHPIHLKNNARIADAKRELGQAKKALELHQESLKGWIELYGENSIQAGEAYMNVGISFHSLQDFEKALENLKRALKINTSYTYNTETIIRNHNSLADVYDCIGEKAKANYHRKKALKLFKGQRQIKVI